MKFGYVLTGVAAAGLTLALTAAWPQDAKAKPKPQGEAPAAPAGGAKPAAAAQDTAPGALQKKAMMPNEKHAQLAALVGTWTATVKHWEDPGQPAQESTGTAVFQMIMDGRFLVENFTSDTPMGQFQGMGVYGHSNVTGEFENFWIDNQSTGMAKNTGEWVADQNAFKWHGEFANLKNGGVSKSQSLMKKVSDTEYQYTMLEDRGGKLFKSIEVTYKKS
jgi:hypothetical protein